MEYLFGFRIAFTSAGSLTAPEFAKVVLLYNGYKVIEGKPTVNKNWVKAHKNPSLLDTGYATDGDVFIPSFIAMKSANSEYSKDYNYDEENISLRPFDDGNAVLWFGSQLGLNDRSTTTSASSVTSMDGKFVELLLPSNLISSTKSAAYSNYCDVHPFAFSDDPMEGWLMGSVYDDYLWYYSDLVDSNSNVYGGIDNCGWVETEIDGVSFTSLR